MSDYGMLQIYCGDGKGKTTASAGLAIRCAGSGGKVLFVQFLKDGSSSEIQILSDIPGISVMYCPASYGFTSRMSDEVRREASCAFRSLLDQAFKRVSDEHIDLLVLDELIGAYRADLLDRKAVLRMISALKGRCEVVITGRNPDEDLLALADYVTQMQCIRHPFITQNLPAREGIEF